jgi:hypothetical protein
MSRNTAIVLITLAIIVVCSICAICIGGYLGLQLLNQQSATAFANLVTEIGVTAEVNFPPTELRFDTPTPPPNINSTPIPTPLPGSTDTLNALESEEIPFNDLRLLAMRLKGIPDIPEVVGDKNNDWPIGQKLDFIASNTDTNENFNLTGTLIYKTENIYLFVGPDVSVSNSEAKAAMDDFQNNIIPTNRGYFGSEANPGIDGDPHIYILYLRGIGFGIGGYDSSADGYSKLAHEASNEKEIFFINADNTSISERYTLAHEFQHLILGAHDPNEETFLNEGASVLSQYLNGDRNIGFDAAFLSDPDQQLNANDQGMSSYGGGFLFWTYFLDRFGQEATKDLIANQDNGLRSFESTLAQINATDPATGQPITLADYFADWVVANYLGDSSVADGRYDYKTYAEAPTVSSPTDTIADCPAQLSATVHQFAADYLEIRCSGSFTLNFTGSRQIQAVPAEPHSGRYFFWSNRGDKSDTSLTREFDLSGLSAATLKYWTWYDIEEDYDYAYVEVSTDGGQTFTILDTPSCTSSNPSGNNFGCGYSGTSGDWIEESVDLSAYAGQTVLVRFEYITDDAVNQNGWLLDDISIPELNYNADFESGEDGWDGQGMVRIDNFLPQQFVVQLIKQGSDTTVERVPLTDSNLGTITFDLQTGETATLVVSGLTLYTTELASYQIDIQ